LVRSPLSAFITDSSSAAPPPVCNAVVLMASSMSRLNSPPGRRACQESGSVVIDQALVIPSGIGKCGSLPP
jgi:hypothetical protein